MPDKASTIFSHRFSHASTNIDASIGQFRKSSFCSTVNFTSKLMFTTKYTSVVSGILFQNNIRSYYYIPLQVYLDDHISSTNTSYSYSSANSLTQHNTLANEKLHRVIFVTLITKTEVNIKATKIFFLPS